MRDLRLCFAAGLDAVAITRSALYSVVHLWQAAYFIAIHAAVLTKQSEWQLMSNPQLDDQHDLKDGTGCTCMSQLKIDVVIEMTIAPALLAVRPG